MAKTIMISCGYGECEVDFENMNCVDPAGRIWNMKLQVGILHASPKDRASAKYKPMFDVFQEAYISYLAEKELLKGD